MQGRRRVSTRLGEGQKRSVLLFSIAALIAFLSFSCSNSEEPLLWEDTSRGGLQPKLESIDLPGIFDADASYLQPVVTGYSSYFMVGQVERPEPTGNLFARSYLRWNVSDLPAGTITTAHISIIFRGISRPDTSTSSEFTLEMREITFRDSIWDEDNLGITYFPEAGQLLDIETFDVTAASDTSDIVFPESFMDTDFAELVEKWRDASQNLGVMIEAAPGSGPFGLLRFISHEGVPLLATSTDTSAKVALTVVVDPDDGGEEITTSFETVAEGYIITAVNDTFGETGGSLPEYDEDNLLLSSGYVRRLALNPDLRGLIDDDTDDTYPQGLTVHKATLKLFPVEDEALWCLDDDEDLALGIYYADSLWFGEDGSLPDWDPVNIALTTITNETDPVELDIATAVQSIFEGENKTILIRCVTETGYFKSVLFHGSDGPEEKRPRLEMVISRPGEGRMDPWPEN